ncbi:MAG: EAL domain-containing protein [Gammaproteobacteria bacterium]|nr:EAL domain-containing protein [Gammaproteobacteria bacterium]
MKLRLPLRHTIPALIFAAGCGVIATAWFVDSLAIERNIHELSERQLRSNAAFVAAELEGAFRNREPLRARAAIERAYSEREVKEVVLVGPDGNIRYASEPRIVGMPVEEAPGLEEVSKALDPDMAANRDFTEVHIRHLGEVGLVAGRFPVQMRGVERDFLPQEFGALYVLYDLSGEMQRQRVELLWRMMPRALILGGLTLIFWIAFRWLLLRRINHLVESVRAVGKGDLGHEPDLRGSDELAELGREISEMIHSLREQSEQLAFLSDHDPLTGLLNRRGFEQEIERAIRRTRFGQSRNVVVLVDIDSLRVVNDTRGHMVGDELLRSFGGMLEADIDEAIAVARVGGDEFGLLLELPDSARLQEKAEKLIGQLHGFDFKWEGDHFGIQVSMGMVAIDGEMREAGAALGYADTAVYVAKERGRGRYAIWQSADEDWDRTHGEMRWVSRINKALEDDRFRLFAQVIEPLSAAAGDGIHLEVLVRMVDENGALVPPGDFIGSAERYNLMGRIDHWVIRKTLAWLEANPGARSAIEMCSINLSGLSFGNFQLLDDLRELLSHSRSVRPTKLCFEVTETTAITSIHHARGFIEQLRAIGCRFALDDFGSGVSSFGYLKNLPVDILKIDGMFVRDICNDPADRAIVTAINSIGHEMGMLTIAEFAENSDIIDMLRELGVDYAQGYGVGKPAPLEDFEKITLPGPRRRA